MENRFDQLLMLKDACGFSEIGREMFDRLLFGLILQNMKDTGRMPVQTGDKIKMMSGVKIR